MVFLLALIFIISIVFTMIFISLAYSYKSQLKTQLKNPSMIRNGFFKFRATSMSAAKNFFFMVFSFGNKEFTTNYIDNYLNVFAIRRTKNNVTNKLLDKVINYTSYYIKFIIISFITISIAPMFA